VQSEMWIAGGFGEHDSVAERAAQAVGTAGAGARGVRGSKSDLLEGDTRRTRRQAETQRDCRSFQLRIAGDRKQQN
jgi:hypothetical protein